jgi:exopolyphosphatase/guanosine-5'-triphosphate,3'-diphosphate pyrophosphatase
MSPKDVIEAVKAPTVNPVAVIDVGTLAIRMQLAEIAADGTVRLLDLLQKAVPLGKDSFTRNRLQQPTIEQCVAIFTGFHQVMQEHGITRPDQVLAVATSAVREAANRDTLLDRIYTATGITVRVIDEAEENRLMYLAFETLAAADPDLKGGDALLIEIGGGSTEVLLVQQERVAFAETYKLGSLRMHETLEACRAPTERSRSILTQHIERTIESIRRSVPAATKDLRFIAMSGDARFAATQLGAKLAEAPCARLDLKAFTAFAEKTMGSTPERLVKRHKLPFQEAETVGPSLLAYVLLARAFKVEQLIVPRISLRDGLLREMVTRDLWSGAFGEQVLHAAWLLARRYQVEEQHARHVAELCARLFAEMQPEHRMSRRLFILLQAAALLHEVGGYVSNRSHHKHSMYLIANSDLFGLTREDLAIIALVARYHRRAVPSATHPEYAALDRDSRIAVSKMAALLRVADALDRGHIQQVRDFTCARESGRLVLTVPQAEDLTLERLAVREKGNLFEEMFGMTIVLREGRAGTTEAPA